MTPFVTPKQDDVMAALRAVLTAALPGGVPVIKGQGNRTSEPKETNYVVMIPLFRHRIETNEDGFDDCKFLGSVADKILTVTTVDIGSVSVNRSLFGANVTADTTILQQITGTQGGPGTYLLDKSMTLAAQVMSCGAMSVAGPYEFDIQLDFHGQGASGSPGDYAQTAAILLRDAWAVDQFTTQSGPAGGGAVEPLYADEPRQIPFVNDQNQTEDRWIVTATLQVNETISVPQEYMDSAVVGLIEVDTFYPAA
jgi:hypothetical protein